MGMGIVSDSEFNSEIGRLNSDKSEPETKSAEIVDVNRGRGHNPEVPNSLRQIIGETSQINGRQEGVELAKNFGISPSSASAYSHGATSTASYDNQPNLNHIEKSKERISKRARSKLLLALNHITEEKLGEAKVRDLSGIARDMSAVVKNLEPDKPINPLEKDKGPVFVFYAPQFRKEEVFDVVYAKE